jgi:hypothetical protein
MKLARYWTRQPGEAVGPGGERVRTVARGWSNESLEAAGAVARDIAHRMAERIASNPSTSKQYGYGDRPLPEPVLREFRNGDEAPRAVITRNSYGALVMNARELMFVDIDREDASGPAEAARDVISSVLSLFGKSKPAPATAPVADAVVAGIQRVAEHNSLAVRVYKTAAGYRVLVVNQPFEAGSGRSDALLREFASDTLYIRLCKMQESFRARLTPKPWRCGLRPPPVTFPFENPKDEAAFREWEAKYTATVARYATCRFVGSYGSGGVQAGFADLIQCHDQETKAASGLALA